MTKKQIKKHLVDVAEQQISRFKEAQGRYFKEGITVRDFDAWLGGYISGLSFHYKDLMGGEEKIDEETFAKDLQDIAHAISEGATAKSIGIEKTEVEYVETFNIAKK